MEEVSSNLTLASDRYLSCAERTQKVYIADNSEIKKGSAYLKDKSKEKDKNYPQELATHFSDTFDVLAWGILEQKKYPEHSLNDEVYVGVGLGGS